MACTNLIIKESNFAVSIITTTINLRYQLDFQVIFIAARGYAKPSF